MNLFSHPIIFAHRGDSAHAPENTLVSFELALAQGADAIELDAKLSADGEVVVIYDATVDRTTDGHGRVARLTLTDLRSLDAGCSFSEKYRGQKIPLLEEVFETVGKKTYINVELTNYAAPRDPLVEKVCALVKNTAWKRESFFHLFLLPILESQTSIIRGSAWLDQPSMDGRAHGRVLWV